MKKEHKCKFKISYVVNEPTGTNTASFYCEYAYLICSECGKVKKVEVEK